MTSTPRRGLRTSIRFAMRTALVLAGAMGLMGLATAGCGEENGVVGGVCAPGFTECSFTCVDLNTDNNNCGQCGHICPPTEQCTGGVCKGNDIVDARADGDEIGQEDVDPRPTCDAADPC